MNTENTIKVTLLFGVILLLSSLALADIYQFNACGAEGMYGPDPGDCGYPGENDVDIVGEGIQEWTVPEHGTYEITAVGGQGGDTPDDSCNPGPEGGHGAQMTGTFDLNEGDTLRILVGQQGEMSDRCGHGGGAGGGGTFVVRNVASGDTMFDGQDVEPLIVAGGGAGGTRVDYEPYNYGRGGWTFNDGPRGSNYGGGYDDSGGAGYSGSGEGLATAFLDGGEGSPTAGSHENQGGFGGGASMTNHQGAGGGGYTGGDGGETHSPSSWGSEDLTESDPQPQPSGSFNAGDNQDNEFGLTPNPNYIGTEGVENEGNGFVEIELIGASDFCDFRGPFNECVMNETNQLQEQEYNVSSIFEARSNAVFEAFNGPATLSLENTTRISGLWRGEIKIESEQPRLEAGASFRPENERIVIGE